MANGIRQCALGVLLVLAGTGVPAIADEIAISEFDEAILVDESPKSGSVMVVTLDGVIAWNNYSSNPDWISNDEVLFQVQPPGNRDIAFSAILNLATQRYYEIKDFRIICYDAEMLRLRVSVVSLDGDFHPQRAGTIRANDDPSGGYVLSLEPTRSEPPLGVESGGNYVLNDHRCVPRDVEANHLPGGGYLEELNEGDGSVTQRFDPHDPPRIEVYSEDRQLITTYFVPESSAQIGRVYFDIRYSPVHHMYYAWDIRRGHIGATPIDHLDARLLYENGVTTELLDANELILFNADDRWRGTNCLRFFWFDIEAGKIGEDEVVTEQCIPHFSMGLSVAAMKGGFIGLTSEARWPDDNPGVYWIPNSTNLPEMVWPHPASWQRFSVSPDGCRLATTTWDRGLNGRYHTTERRLLIIDVCP